MAILPRIMLTQPAPAAVAAVSMFGFTILGMSAYGTLERQELHDSYAAPCAPVEARLGERRHWQERDFVLYAACFAQHNDDLGVIEVASSGLKRYPQSQVLFNLKGYHEIGLHEFDDAVKTLESGLQQVPEQSNGVMENNLAWAYLWIGDGGTERARALYQASLSREPYICEALHTGLFVEFEIARASEGLAQAEALRNFQSLRTRYQDCENRDGSWDTVVETAGAAVLYTEVEALLGTTWDQRGMDLTMSTTAASLRRHHPAASAAVLCGEAIPMADLRDACVASVREGVRK